MCDPRNAAFDGILCLAGPPGSGKTTAGLIISKTLEIPFFDLDRLIEEKAGRPVERIFTESGETHFRRLEFECLQSAVRTRPSVLAVGGGCLLDRDAFSLVLESTILVTLVASDEALTARCEGGSRPLAVTDTDLVSLLQSRRDHYLSLPNRIETDGLTPAEVADRIESLLNHLTAGHGAPTGDPSP